MSAKYNKTRAACYLGYVAQSIVVNLAPLFFVIFRRDFGFSYSFIATLVFATFAIQMAVDAASVRFISSLGYKRCAILSQITSAVGIFLLGALPQIMAEKHAAVMIAVLFYSVGGALIEVVISPIIDALPSKSSEASMSFLHSFYSWGQVFVILVTTLLLLVTGERAWYVIPFIWTALPVVNIFLFAASPVIEPEKQDSVAAAKDLFRHGAFILTVFLMISAGAAEQIMAQWASLFCERGLGVDKVVGDLMGPCLFAAFMGIGRTWYGAVGERVNLSRALAGCSSLAIVCYLVTVFSGNSFLSLAGCAFCGLGVSLLWPGMISLTSKNFPAGGPAMFALLALGGDIGCSVGPFLTGQISDAVSKSQYLTDLAGRIGMGLDEFSLKCGILAGIVFPVFMLVGTLLLRKNK